jgi:hypothetical protein
MLLVFHRFGGQDEEKRKDKSFEGSPQEKECQKIIEKIKGRKKIPHLIRSLKTHFLTGWNVPRKLRFFVGVPAYRQAGRGTI